MLVMAMVRLLICWVASSTAVTVTAWAVFQLDGVKVNLAGLTVAAAGLPETIAISTSAVGEAAKANV